MCCALTSRAPCGPQLPACAPARPRHPTAAPAGSGAPGSRPTWRLQVTVDVSMELLSLGIKSPALDALMRLYSTRAAARVRADPFLALRAAGASYTCAPVWLVQAGPGRSTCSACGPRGPSSWRARRLAHAVATKLQSQLHTESHAQLALVDELDRLCRTEGSTHVDWDQLARQAVLALGPDPGEGRLCCVFLGAGPGACCLLPEAQATVLLSGLLTRTCGRHQPSARTDRICAPADAPWHGRHWLQQAAQGLVTSLELVVQAPLADPFLTGQPALLPAAPCSQAALRAWKSESASGLVSCDRP